MQGLRAKLNKGEIATMNYKTLETMASQLSSTSNVHDAFLLRKMIINHEGKKTKLKSII
jgi:ribosomal protein S6